MEYQVTATRRRPQSFDQLLGQDFVAATLQKSIESGKIAHAYLFSGPRGCGKTSSARILAKALNCEKGPTPMPCGTCVSCDEITAGANLDVFEIDGASNTGVDDVRKIKDEILFPPNTGRYKIYIIDEVHMLSTSAFNALLKTIEEPPPYVVFIFATTELHKVPATIKSRCQHFNFKLVDVEILKNALSNAVAEQGITADEESLFWIAGEATGSVRDAYTLFDQVAAFSDGHITFEKIQDKLGLTGIDTINALFISCVNKNSNEALYIIDEIMRSGISVEQFIIDCTKYLRSLLLVKHGITKESIIGQKADRFPVDVLQIWNEVQIERALAILLQLFKDIRFSVNPRYDLELAASRLSWLSDYISPIELKNIYQKIKTMLQSGNVSTHIDQKVSTAIKTNHTNINKIDEQPPVDSYDQVSRHFYKADNFNENTQNTVFGLGESKKIVRKCDFNNLKDVLVSDMALSHGMISTALNATDLWQYTEDNGITILIPVKRNFDLAILHKNKDIICKKASELLDEQVLVNFCEVQPKNDNVKQKISSIPEEVETARKILQGKIIGQYNAMKDNIEEDENEF